MVKKADLSPAEFRVMNILWRRGCATVKEIQAEIGDQKPLARTTINTLMTRMKDKGFVEAIEKNFAYEFHPLVERQSVTKNKLSELVDKVLEGNIGLLAAYIVENRDLTPDQVTALEEIVKSESRREDS